jgi:hypothetical protein
MAANDLQVGFITAMQGNFEQAWKMIYHDIPI